MHCAPTGYPPKHPVIHKLSPPSGILRVFRSQQGILKDMEPVKRGERTRKGKSAGITLFIHKSMPSLQPNIQVALLNINASIMQMTKAALAILETPMEKSPL